VLAASWSRTATQVSSSISAGCWPGWSSPLCAIHTAPQLWSDGKQRGMSRYRLNPQAFLLSSHDVDGIKFAALDTLQYGRTRKTLGPILLDAAT
jgi:hypothetical protein